MIAPPPAQHDRIEVQDLFQFTARKREINLVLPADQVADALVAQVGFVGIGRLFRQDFDDLSFFMTVEISKLPRFPGHAPFGIGDDEVESRLAVVG